MTVEDQIRETVWSVARSSFTSLRGQLQRAHLSPPQFWVLQMVEASPALSPSQISSRLGVRTPTATGFLDLLAKQGFIQRIPSPQDRRRATIQLTGRGARTVRSIRERLQARWHETLSSVPVSRKREILEALTELEERIEGEPVRREFCRPPRSPPTAQTAPRGSSGDPAS